MDGLQFILQKPVLQAAQLRQIVLAAAVNQCVFIDPADAGGIRAQFRACLQWQLATHLAQVFQYPRACPVRIGTVLEYDVHKRIAKKGIATHGHRLGHGEHGSGQWVGDLVLDHLWCLSGVSGLDNDLHIGKVRYGIQRRAFYRIDAPARQNKGEQYHHEAIAQRPADDLLNHGCVTCSSVSGRVMRIMLALRLASESIRN